MAPLIFTGHSLILGANSLILRSYPLNFECIRNILRRLHFEGNPPEIRGNPTQIREKPLEIRGKPPNQLKLMDNHLELMDNTPGING